jgi:putative oxidoreductase
MINMRTNPDLALLMLRLPVGFAFFMHGLQKWQMGIGNVATSFGQMGIPLPGIAAPFIGGLEVIGGIALMLGLLTRVFGFLLFCDMFVATMLVHLKNGWLGQGGMELTAVLGAAAVALALAGAGRYSVDGAMAGRRAAAAT